MTRRFQTDISNVRAIRQGLDRARSTSSRAAGKIALVSAALAVLGPARMAVAATGVAAAEPPMSNPPAGPAAPPVIAGSPGLRPALPGQLSTRFGIDPNSPEASVPTNEERNRSPLEFGYFLQDLLEQAETARKAKDYQGVIRYFRAVAKAVPENAKGWSKLCEAYEIVNDRERATVACRYAIDRPSVEVQDFARYVRLVVGKSGDLTDKETSELKAALAHMETQPGTEVTLAVAHLRCQVGVKLKDVGMMETCTQALSKLAPEDPKTMVFRWSLAMMNGQRSEAKRLLEDARATGVPRESIALMESVLPSSALSWRRAGVAVVAVLLTAALLGALVLAMRRRRALS